MANATCEVIPHEGEWGVDHQDNAAAPFASKEAALEATLGSAINATKYGHDVRLVIPGSGGAEATLERASCSITRATMRKALQFLIEHKGGNVGPLIRADGTG